MISHWLDATDFWKRRQLEAYGWLHRLNPRAAVADHTVLVVIGDDEYWAGPLAARAPLKRDYLARIVRALDAANVSVIALDVDLRTPGPGLPDVVGRTLRRAAKGGYLLDDWVLGEDGGPQARASPSARGPAWGYIEAPRDIRRVPLAVNTQNAGQVPSFSEAIVQASHAAALGPVRERGGAFPYAGFLGREAFRVCSAGQVVGDEAGPCDHALAHQIAIVGADWHRLGYGRGKAVDPHPTPAGELPGLFVHANYVEALIDQRVATPLPRRVGTCIEFALVLAAAVAMTLFPGLSNTVVIVAGAALLLALLSYFFLQNLGVYSDLLVPIAMVGLHSGFEQVREWRRQASRKT
jgi:CHASE2 domain-containing sensor protein